MAGKMSIGTMQHREVSGNLLQQFDEDRISNHWRRNKKASIDLQELPVAVDRQLEDQRILMERNRNPQLNVPTKVDRVRSEQIIAKVGTSRAVAIKAKVLNKIVREVSGMNDYVITAPPRSEFEIFEPEVDADTNPHFKAYAKETKNNPVIVSFGHRPRSASRTFNPATMRFRMRHSEMVKAPGAGKYGFGLPVGILAKILKAPKIEHFGANQSLDREDDGSLPSLPPDPHDLFSLPNHDEPESSLAERNVGFNMAKGLQEESHESLGNESWISPTQHSMELQQKAGKKAGMTAGKFKSALALDTSAAALKNTNSSLDDRSPWDEAHHNVKYSPKEIYKIKANIMPNQPYTILERMQRFNAKAIADEITPFCQGKQALDMEVLRTGKAPNIVISPTKGIQKFFDPNNTNLDYVKKNREEADKKMERKLKRKGFQESLMSIPKVLYHPETLSLQLKSGQVRVSDIPRLMRNPTDWENFQPPPVVIPRAGAESKVLKASLSVRQDSLASASVSASSILSQSESDLIAAMRRAKHGNQRALFNLFLSNLKSSSASAETKTEQIEQWIREVEQWESSEVQVPAIDDADAGTSAEVAGTTDLAESVGGSEVETEADPEPVAVSYEAIVGREPTLPSAEAESAGVKNRDEEVEVGADADAGPGIDVEAKTEAERKAVPDQCATAGQAAVAPAAGGGQEAGAAEEAAKEEPVAAPDVVSNEEAVNPDPAEP